MSGQSNSSSSLKPNIKMKRTPNLFSCSSIKVLILLILLTTFLSAQDTVTIVYYNILWYPRTEETRDEHYVRILDELDADILVLTEMRPNGLEPFLNNVIGEIHDIDYAQSSFHPCGDSDVQLYYNADLFHLLEQHFIDANTRDLNEYVLGYRKDESIRLNVIGAHLKASKGDHEEELRFRQCRNYREHMSDNTEDHYIIFGGDLNFYSSDEKGFQRLIMSGDDQLFDPIALIGDWHANQEFAITHTQSTRTEGFGAGGMDDRFDFILVNSAILDQESEVRYIEGTYFAYGNSGNLLDKAIDDPINTSLSPELLLALKEASDHIPVVMQICIQCD